MPVKTAGISFNHHQPIQIRFNDIDILGHVNNSIYLQYMDLAKLNYFTSVLGDAFDWHEHSMVIVNINCDFLAITIHEEPIEVLTAIDKIGDHSMTLVQQVVNTATGQVKCKCRTVMVAYSISARESIEVPDAWRSRINAYESPQSQAPGDNTQPSSQQPEDKPATTTGNATE